MLLNLYAKLSASQSDVLTGCIESLLKDLVQGRLNVDDFSLIPHDKSRDKCKSVEPLVRSLERLQEVFTVSSLSSMQSRLQRISKQQGMGFHVAEATCYLTADLFYLEVVLLPCGGVEDVKVASHGGFPVASESLLQMLRSKDFTEFSVKLASIFDHYNIQGDNKIKLTLFTSLQWLGTDLQHISDLPRVRKDSDPQVDLINNGRIGCLIAGKDDSPLKIQFYISPTESLNTSDSHAAVQAAQVALGVTDVHHQLQVASLLPQPAQLDPSGDPVFLPLSEALCEALPACFLLKLQPPIPMTASSINKLCQITDMIIPDVDLQWAPFPKLLLAQLSATSHEETADVLDTVFTLSLPDGVTHSYILPGSAWEQPPQIGAGVDSIPFTHPAHVPSLLELLRDQCIINTLLKSCFTSQPTTADYDLRCEVLPESETSFSVTFHQPGTDSLSVLLVNISNSHQIQCSLFGAGSENLSMNDDLSAIMKRSMSVPETLMALNHKLEEIASASPTNHCLATTQPQNDHWAPLKTTVSDSDSTFATLTHSASVPDLGYSTPGSAYFTRSAAASERRPEINANPVVNRYPFSPVSVFPRWLSNSSQLSKLI